MSITVRALRVSALLVVTAISVPLFSLPSLAQTQGQNAGIGAANGIADPGRVQEQLPPPVMPQSVDAAQLGIRPLPPVSAPAGAEKINFTLRAVRVEGMQAYDKERIAATYAARIGKKMSLADVYGIAADITRIYRNDGYLLTQVVVPPQTIDDGDVRLMVVEGYIDQIEVRGGNDSERPLIQSYADRLRNNGPLNAADMERALLLISDLPGMRARSILSPSKTKTGAADLTILVDRKLYDAEIDVNNYGTKYLGPLQLGASGALNSVLGLNERITAQTVYAPSPHHLDPELMYYALGYLQPVGPYGTTVELVGSYTDTEPGYTLSQFNVEGKSTFGGITVAHPIIRSRQINLTGRFGFDARDVRTSDDLQPTRHDRIRALRAGMKYEMLDSVVTPAYNMVDVQLSQGLGLFGATDDGNADTSRPGADDSFTRINVDLQRLQRVAPSWNVLAAVSGQYAFNQLLTSEQFGLGGLGFGRGYDPSEIIGDNGIAAKAEVQWENPVRLDFVSDWQAFGFYDIGKVWNPHAVTDIDEKNSLASTGLGLRASFQSGTAFNAVLAFPLTRDVQTHDDRDPRVFVGLSQRF